MRNSDKCSLDFSQIFAEVFFSFHFSLIKSQVQGLTRPVALPSLGCPDEELTKEPALLIFVVSDGVVQLMADSNLKGKNNEIRKRERI